MDGITPMQKLFALTVLYRHNIQMLHWNVVGSGFDPAHETLDGFVNTMATHVDQLAEMMKMIDQRPLQLTECVDVLKNDNAQFLIVDAGDIDVPTCWEKVNTMFAQLYDATKTTKSGDEIPDDIESELESMMYYYSLEGKYKGKSRVKNTTHQD